jgi:hypothetical protein
MLTQATRKYLETGSLEGFTDADLENVSIESENIGDIMAPIHAAVESLDEADRDYNDLVEAHAAIEGYVELMQLGAENGGITPMTAAAIRVGIESWEQKLGLEKPIVASVESFGGTSSQLHATQVSLEEGGNTLTKLWEGLKRLLAFIAEKAKEIAKTITDGAFRLHQRATKVAAKAAATKGTASKNSIEVDTAGITADGKGVDIDDAMNFARAVGQDQVRATNAYVKELAQAAAGLDPKSESFYDGLAKVVERLGNYSPGAQFESVSGDEVGKRWKDSVAYRTKQIMPGNKAFYVVLPSKALIQKDEKGKSILGVIGKVHTGVYPVTGAKAVESGKKPVGIQAPTALASTASKIANFSKQISDMSNKADMKEALGALKTAGEAITSRGAGEDTAANSAASLVIKALTHTKKILHGPSHKGLALATSTMAAQLRLVEQQLAAYGKGGDGEKKEEGTAGALPAPQA